MKHIKKTKGVKDNIGLFISDFAITVGCDVDKEKYNKAHRKCMERIYKHIFPYKP